MDTHTERIEQGLTTAAAISHAGGNDGELVNAVIKRLEDGCRLKPIGYAHMWESGFLEFDTQEAAREEIEKSFREVVKHSQSYLVAILAKAELELVWDKSSTQKRMKR